ncbi:iron chaperone [Sporosarcina luteola]|uniref:iron chaperone n=1 Tax=Sporosarcina luteola TaxID=582850 RepID=UPI00203CB2EB|nr:iron chaperone [Sporosarcina luteola]MCM3709239.1 iron chaperone [Sporosarcina luteola]
MEVFAEFLTKIDNPEHRARTEEVLSWVKTKYPELTPVIKWNQPMFIDHGTYIIGFSVSKQHLAASPEQAGIIHFSDQIVEAGYKHTKMLVQFPWSRPFDYGLLEKMIEYNISDKAECTTFWR